MTHLRSSVATIRAIALAALLVATLVAPSAFAQAGNAAAAASPPPASQIPARPVYLDIVPAGNASNSLLPPDLVAAMAQEALSNAQEVAIRLDNQPLPADVRVLRIVYIVHVQQEAGGVTLAASASTEKLQTVADDSGAIQTFSMYSGLQQTLVQGPDAVSAKTNLQQQFRQELDTRIAAAFADKPAVATGQH